MVQEQQEQATREMLNRIERLISKVSDNAVENSKGAGQAATEMATQIAKALLNPPVDGAVAVDGVVAQSASGFETIDFPSTGLHEDIETFYGVGEDNTEEMFETERRYDPDADRFDPALHPMAEQFGWVSKSKVDG